MSRRRQTRSQSPSARSSSPGSESGDGGREGGDSGFVLKKESEYSKAELIRYRARFNKYNFPLEQSNNADKIQKPLKTAEFKSLVDTLKQDIKNVDTVTKVVYGNGERGHWKKSLARQYLAQLMKKMDLLHKYYKVKSGARKRGGGANQAGQLKGSFYVFANVYDWINDTNMGNGFVSQMAHHKEPRASKGGEEKEHAKKSKKNSMDVKKFIGYANTGIDYFNSKVADPADRISRTDAAELMRLIYRHAPIPNAGSGLGNNYEVDAKGNLADVQNNDDFFRMVEIQRAYAGAVNREKNNNAVHAFTDAEAAAMLLPQQARFGGVNVANILDRNITLKSTGGAEYRSAAISSGMCTVILALMANANKLQDHGLSGYIHYDIFEKYFHAKPSDNYEPGTNVAFYLPDVESGNPVSVNLGITGDDEASMLRSVITTLPSINTSTKSASTVSSADKLVTQILAGDAGKVTAFDYINKGDSQKKAENRARKQHLREEGKLKKTGDELKETREESFIQRGDPAGYGIKTFAATQIAYLYKVPMDALSDSSRSEIVTTTNTGGKVRHTPVQSFQDSVDAVRNFLSSINDVYRAYADYDKATKEKAAKAANKATTPEARAAKRAAFTEKVRGTPSNRAGPNTVRRSPTPRTPSGASPGRSAPRVVPNSPVSGSPPGRTPQGRTSPQSSTGAPSSRRASARSPGGGRRRNAGGAGQ